MLEWYICSMSVDNVLMHHSVLFIVVLIIVCIVLHSHLLTFSFIYNLFGPALQDLLISVLNEKVLL